MDKRINILKIIGRCLSVLSILFIVYAVWRMGFDFSFVNNKVMFIIVIITGIIIKLASLWLSSSAWSTWLKYFSKKPFEMKDARRVFIKANIGKYIPGNVMHFVQRNIFASDMGVGQKQLAVSTVFEVLSYVFVAALFSIITAGKSLISVVQMYFGEKMIIFEIIVFIMIILTLIVCFIMKNKVREVLMEYDKIKFMRAMVKVMVVQIVTLTLLGSIMLILTVYAKGWGSFSSSGVVVSAYIVAWVLGFIVPGASGGMGIRELALLFLLGPVLGEELVLSLSIVHRLITIIGDFVAYLVVVIQVRCRKVCENNA